MCQCGGPRAPATPAPRAMPPPQAIPRAIPRAIPTPPPNAVRRIAPAGSYNLPDRFCKVCGWAIKASKLPGPNGVLIEQRACTNRMCQNFRK
jgi:hypothetical protein